MDIITSLIRQYILDSITEFILKYREKRKLKKRIQQLVRDYEWFESLYQDQMLNHIIVHDPDVHEVLLDREAIITIDLNLEERQRFEEWLIERSQAA